MAEGREPTSLREIFIQFLIRILGPIIWFKNRIHLIMNNSFVILTIAYDSQDSLDLMAKQLNDQICQPKKWLIVNNSPRSVGSIKLDVKCNLSILNGIEGEGFAQGCNRGLNQLQNEGWDGWVWLLNPDIFFLDRETLVNLQKQIISLPSNALVGTAVIDKNGQMEPSAGWVDYGLSFRSRCVNASFGKAIPIQVDWLSGCNLFFKPKAHAFEPRFDESFPLYYEDMDFCLRLGAKNIPSLWLANIVIGHDRGLGSKTSLSRRLRLSSCSYIRFLQRHLPVWVLYLRSMILVFKAILRLPIDFQTSCAVIQGWFEAFRRPIK